MEPKRILIFGYRHIGDTLFITPAISAIREKFKKSYIAVITGYASKDILSNNPNIDEVIVLPNNSFSEKMKIRKFLKDKKFDAIFLFQHTFLNAIFAFLLGAKYRIGLDWKGCGFLLTHKIKYSEEWHEIERYLKIANIVGVEVKDKKPKVYIDGNEENYAKDFLKNNNISENDLIIGLNPGSSEKWKIKRWSLENYVKLSDNLIEKYSAKIIVFCGPIENELIEKFLSLSTHKVTFVKERSLRNLAALIKMCRLFITNDTGPMHIANTVGTKVIDIVGPSNIKKTGPYGGEYIIIRKNLPCSPCKKLKCDDLSCLKLIKSEEVLDVIDKNL